MLILKHSASARLNYLNRTLYPALCETIAIAFDRRLTDAACKLLRVAVDTNISTRLFLPTRDNIGFGFRPSVDVHTIAYLASIAMAMHFDKADDTNVAFFSPELDRELTSIIQRANNIFTQGNVLCYSAANKRTVLQYPSSLREFRERARDWKWVSGLHSQTCKAMSDAKLVRIRAQLSTSRDAIKHIDSIVMKGSATCLNVCPSSRHTHLDDEAFRIYSRLRLGLPVSDSMPMQCGSAQCKISPAAVPLHYFSCSHISCGMTNSRHDEVRDNFITAARRAGYTVRPEPRVGVGKRRGDLHLACRA